MTLNRKRGAILISGRGSNMVSLLRAAQVEDFPVEFSMVISDKIEAPGLGIATSAGVKTHALRHCRDGRDGRGRDGGCGSRDARPLDGHLGGRVWLDVGARP